MNICNDNSHGAIVHEERDCPACERIQELKDEIGELNDEIVDQAATIKNLEAKL